ncbi:MAG: S41 family peptidase, partial [Aurantibacter sp.]
LEIEAVKANELTKALMNNLVVFDYATDYYYKNQLQQVSDFKFSDADFNSFKNFVQQSSFSFETTTEKTLKEALVNEEDIFDDSLKDDYTNLLNQIQQGKLTALGRHQKEIQKKLEDEIVTRYFYRDGLYDYYLQNDEAIVTATQLLADIGKYERILK